MPASLKVNSYAFCQCSRSTLSPAFLAIAPLPISFLAIVLLSGCRTGGPVAANVASAPIPRALDDLALPNRQSTPDDSVVVPVSGVQSETAKVTLAVAPSLAIDDGIDDGQATSEAEPKPLGQTQSIDLSTALMLAAGQNPQISYARARIEESLANWDRANALKLPSIRAGVNYNKHEGQIQDVAGTVFNTSRGSFYSGLGAGAVGAGSPAVPGIVSQFHFADAVFQPKIAERTICARRAGAQATTNDTLLATAVAYTDLLRAEQDVAVLENVVAMATKLVSTTSEFARVGEGLESDHDRARTELALRQIELSRAEEAAAVASSKLAELLHWDSPLRLTPAESQLTVIHLAESSATSQELVATALANRPELEEARHLVGEAIQRWDRERHAAFIPSVLLAASYGGLGGGLGSDLTNYGDRLDADAMAFWEIRQIGAGERAATRETRAKIAQARTRQIAQMDRIAREVIEAHHQVSSRSKQISLAEAAIATAEQSYTKNWDRIRNGEGLPIEALQSLQALAASQREYARAIADFNTAQFHLHRAQGWPIHDATR